MAPATPPPFLVLGRVLRPHGVRGELRLEVLTSYPERIVPGRRVFIGPDPNQPASAVQHTVTHARRHQKLLLLTVEAIRDRQAADLVRDHYVMVTLEDAVPLEDGEFYLFQVLGVQVHTEDGELLGQVVEVLETGANDVYVVHGPRGEVLLPDIAECVLKIDIAARTMTVRLLDGLLDG